MSAPNSNIKRCIDAFSDVLLWNDGVSQEWLHQTSNCFMKLLSAHFINSTCTGMWHISRGWSCTLGCICTETMLSGIKETYCTQDLWLDKLDPAKLLRLGGESVACRGSWEWRQQVSEAVTPWCALLVGDDAHCTLPEGNIISGEMGTPHTLYTHIKRERQILDVCVCVCVCYSR